MAPPLTFGPAVPAPDFENIRKRMALDFCKWDLQIGDTPNLFRQPLLISEQTWAELKIMSDRLACELKNAEAELLHRPDLYPAIGLPRPLQGFPCIGVYTVDGEAAGVYARISKHPIIDYSAIDVAVLISEDQNAESK